MFKKKTIETNTGKNAEYNVLKALTQEYLIIVTVEMSSGHCSFNRVAPTLIPALQNSIIQEHNYEDLIRDYATDNLIEEDRKQVIRSLSIENIKKELAVSDRFSFLARREHNGEYEHLRVEVRKLDADRFILSVRNADNEVRDDNSFIEELQNDYRRAIMASGSKKKYIYNISHDIRTPLNAIIGYSTVAADNFSDQKLLKKCLDKIDDAGQQVLGIINEILDLNELEENGIRVKNNLVTMADLERQVTESVRAQVKDKKLDMFVKNHDTINPVLNMDINHMVRVLVNLISYSSKHTEAGGSVALTIMPIASPESGYRNYRFNVEDTGFGLNQTALKEVKEYLSEIDSDALYFANDVDINIVVAKNIVMALGGSLEIDSEQDKGTVFTIHMNFEIGKETEKEDAEAEEHVVEIRENTILSGTRILIVDDSQASCEVLTTILAGLSARTEVAYDGYTGIDMIVNNEVGYYDLVLMDIEMPSIDGYETTRQIRGLHRPDAKTLPIVAVTGVVFEDAKNKANECGMDGFITKPINVAEMKQILGEVLKQKQTEKRTK